MGVNLGILFIVLDFYVLIVKIVIYVRKNIIGFVY